MVIASHVLEAAGAFRTLLSSPLGSIFYFTLCRNRLPVRDITNYRAWSLNR